MLHLLPIRWLLRLVFTFAALVVLSANYAGWLASGELTQDAIVIARWVRIGCVILIGLFFAVWRWIPPIQRSIFPYLGGRWSGYIQFEEDGGLRRSSASLEVKHTLFGVRLLLDTKESSSSTLAVHAERDSDFDRYRLFYVFVNERKDGFLNAGQRYRGLAVIRVELGEHPALHGSYFTDTDRRGILHLTSEVPNPWWKLWR
jgi:hypothetical protein